ncbi:histidine kinase [Actinomadura rubrisoli]|uniref:histidine kinase n=2 Tax=Actinomadura rubrisoli TaxID=2530368 RepID=A0A4R5BMZ5_9ACTN|nr:histidine kinase [Actinomadura rubrisoli]
MFAFTAVDYLPGRGDVAVLAFAAASGATAALARWRLWPLFAVTALGSLLFSTWPGFIVASYYAATTLRSDRLVAAYTGAATAALLGVPLLNSVLGTGFALGPDDRMAPGERVFSVLLLVGSPLAAGLWINARRQVLAGLRERGARLEREQAARAEQARAAERARIAREMHDVVAHKVSLMVLHAGALEVEAPDDGTERTAALIRATGREALTDLREVLEVLRSPGGADPLGAPPTLDGLDRLVHQSQAAGLPVRRDVEGTARPLPAAAERAAYHVVREALTNVHKHAGGAATRVTLRYLPAHLEVTVRNDPPPSPAEALPGSGLGLAGLRERLALVGGHLDAAAHPDGGFAVHARIPARP